MSFFAHSGIPLTVAIVLDTSGSMDGALGAAQEAATGLIRRLAVGDRAAVVDFDARVNVVQPFTVDIGALEHAVRSMVADGQTALYDALFVSLQESKGWPTRRSIRRGDTRSSSCPTARTPRASSSSTPCSTSRTGRTRPSTRSASANATKAAASPRSRRSPPCGGGHPDRWSCVLPDRHGAAARHLPRDPSRPGESIHDRLRVDQCPTGRTVAQHHRPPRAARSRCPHAAGYFAPR